MGPLFRRSSTVAFRGRKVSEALRIKDFKIYDVNENVTSKYNSVALSYVFRGYSISFSRTMWAEYPKNTKLSASGFRVKTENER